MHAWEAIQTTIETIEVKLKEEITIEELAQSAHLSQYYFQRLFNRLVGKTVNEYIKARRLANAKNELRLSDKRILDIALEYGFQSHETFTKSFKELYQITPEAYRKGDMLLTDFLKPDLSMQYIVVDEFIPLLVDGMILEIRNEKMNQPQYFTGISKIAEASEMNKVGVNAFVSLWDQFNKTKDTISNLLEDGVVIDYFTYAYDQSHVKYFVGGESSNEHSDAYDQIVMEAGNYYVCSFEAENFEYLVSDALYKANHYFFDTWLKHKGIQMQDMESFLVQKYLRTKDNPSIEIWIQVKK